MRGLQRFYRLTVLILSVLSGRGALESTAADFFKWEEFSALLVQEDHWQQQQQDHGYYSGKSRDLNVDSSGSSSSSSSLAGRPLASQLIGGTPVYISMTTIHNRLYGIAATIETILRGSVLPTHIYIFVSSEPYLLDQGISKDFMVSSSGKLRALSEAFPHISVIFTDNIGPHRKLLPLLAKKWDEDCVIVTVDDHEMYPKGMLASLLDYYRASDGTAVVALRSRRMGICTDSPPWRVSSYTKNHKGLWPETKPGHREMLMLPTGTGGVLYRPQFFHPIIFDRRFLNLTRTGDDLMFRLATMAKGIAVVTACTEYEGHGNVCPTEKDIELRVATPEPPLFVPLLKSIKQADLGGPPKRRGTKTSLSAGAGLGGQTGGTPSGPAAAPATSPLRGSNEDARASTDTDGASRLSRPRPAVLGSPSQDTTLLQEEIAAALEERDKTTRTLQQKKETKLAMLNEAGSLRHRRLARRDYEENGAELNLSEAAKSNNLRRSADRQGQGGGGAK